MNYELAYDAASNSLVEWGFIDVGVLFLILGAILIFFPKARMLLVRGKTEKFSLMISRFLFGFAVLWTVLASSATFFDNRTTRISSIENTCTPIEGIVENFHPMPHDGHKDETFEVQNINFHYSDYVLTGGFNNTASHGGPISEGLPVKICYLFSKRKNANLIVRLEVGKKI